MAKKNLRRAVDRNRVKRVIREWFRLQQWQLPPMDIVVQAKVNAREAQTKELLNSLNQAPLATAVS